MKHGQLRRLGLRELRFVVPDAYSEAVRDCTATQVAKLNANGELEALLWIEAVSEFDVDAQCRENRH